MTIRTDGIVIREREAGTQDKLVTLLSREYGVTNAFANGGRSPKNKNVAATDLLCYSDFSLEKNKKGTLYIKEATVKNVFFPLRNDIVTLTLSQYLAELTNELAPREEKAEEFLSLLLNSLHLLSCSKKDKTLIKAVAELRMLTLSGYMPQLIGCSGCGVYEAEKMFFDALSGEIFCEGCRPAARLCELSPGALTAMRHICLSAPEKIFSFTLSAQGLCELAAASEKYLLGITGKRFKTLDFYKSMTDF